MHPLADAFHERSAGIGALVNEIERQLPEKPVTPGVGSEQAALLRRWAALTRALLTRAWWLSAADTATAEQCAADTEAEARARVADAATAERTRNAARRDVVDLNATHRVAHPHTL